MDALRAAAVSAFTCEDYEGALTHFTHLIELEPDDSSLYCNRSSTLLHLGRRAEALADAEKAVGLAKNAPPKARVKALYRLATALHDDSDASREAVQRTARAREVCNAALEMVPEQAQLRALSASIEVTLRASQSRVAPDTPDASNGSPKMRIMSRRLPPPQPCLLYTSPSPRDS